jgi:hypothetical protein
MMGLRVGFGSWYDWRTPRGGGDEEVLGNAYMAKTWIEGMRKRNKHSCHDSRGSGGIGGWR